MSARISANTMLDSSLFTFILLMHTGVHHVLYTTWCVCRFWCTPRFLYHMMCVSFLVYTTFSIPHDVCVVTGVHHVLYTTWCVCRYWCTPRFLYHMMCVSLLVYTTFSIPHDTGVHHVLYTTWYWCTPHSVYHMMCMSFHSSSLAATIGAQWFIPIFI